MINGKYVNVVIVAAGTGSRMNSKLNKQFIDLDGVPVIARTIKAFNDSKIIDKIVVVISEELKANFINEIELKYDFHKLYKIVVGGKERQESVFNGLNSLEPSDDIVLIHDGARPFISNILIEKIVQNSIEHKALIVAVPVKDTIKVVNNNMKVEKTLNRESLWAVQTPQVFRLNEIIEAHVYASENNIVATDDASLYELLGKEVHIIYGDYNNIKITTIEDLTISKIILDQINLK